jgi:hypothetical protein
MSNLRWALPFVCVLTIGCGGPQPESVRVAAQDKKAPPEPAAVGKQERQAERPVDRKIIRTAQVELVVDDFDKGEAALRQLVKSNEGYVAKSEVRSPWDARDAALGYLDRTRARRPLR